MSCTYRGKPLSEFEFEMFTRSEMFGPGEHWVPIDPIKIVDLRRIPEFVNIGLLRMKGKSAPDGDYITRLEE